ncbi:DUF4974 domain-containing protein [Postechiella marina]|uniref:DUF4974 domain-containing protein n=1 Tax=Postechiella marina TaxID=943941 RepID=A0ABP8CFE5_9FLAO
MRTIKDLIKLSKSIASSLLDKQDVNTSEVNNLFSTEDTEDILEHLLNPTKKKERESLVRHINETKNEDWAMLKSKTTYKRNKYQFKFTPYKVAVVLFICLGISYFYIEKSNYNKALQENNSVANPNKIDAIILELDNGNKQIIASNDTKNIINKNGKLVGFQNGTKINYANTKTNKKTEELVYNKLTIPYGKTFQVVLSDGSTVHLNAGSSLRYPVNFIEGKNRLVFLKGEAYFDIKKNKKQPFIVNTDDMQIKVLGTKFNVSSYPEDYNINTVLVEGSVAINSINKNFKTENTILVPGQKARWKKENGDIKVRKVNTSLHTAWIDGKIVFKHMRFKNILKKLERHYNISITNNNKKLSEESFTASFDIESIDQVLNSFNKNFKFDYTINANHIIIN